MSVRRSFVPESFLSVNRTCKFGPPCKHGLAHEKSWAKIGQLLSNVYSIFRKILVSIKFLSAILGPEMGASILWTHGKMRSFCRKNLHVHKIPPFRGVYFGFGGGGSADFIFTGARIFLIIWSPSYISFMS